MRSYVDYLLPGILIVTTVHGSWHSTRGAFTALARRTRVLSFDGFLGQLLGLAPSPLPDRPARRSSGARPDLRANLLGDRADRLPASRLVLVIRSPLRRWRGRVVFTWWGIAPSFSKVGASTRPGALHPVSGSSPWLPSMNTATHPPRRSRSTTSRRFEPPDRVVSNLLRSVLPGDDGPDGVGRGSRWTTESLTSRRRLAISGSLRSARCFADFGPRATSISSSSSSPIVFQACWPSLAWNWSLSYSLADRSTCAPTAT